MNATVIGTLVGGVLLFLSSLLVPIISKRLNKATDAASSAEKIASGAEKNSDMALRIAEGIEKKLERTEKQCNACLGELGQMKIRAGKRDRSLDAIHQALLEIVPLLDADAAATTLLRAAITRVAEARYET